MICPKCGSEISEESAFCQKCGTMINAENVASNLGKRKKGFSKILIVVSIICICVLCAVIYMYNSQPAVQYANAEKAYANGKYEKAVRLYTAVGDYEGAEKKLKEALIAYHYHEGIKQFEKKQYAKALEEFSESAGFENTKELIRQCNYFIGKDYFEKGDYILAAESFGKADGYEDSENKIMSMGKELVDEKNYEEAVKVYNNASGWANDEYARYANGIINYNNGDYFKAANHFENAGNIFDSKDKYNESMYIYASKQLENKNYDEALSFFEKIDDYKDSLELINACNLLSGRQEMKMGNLNEAKNRLDTVPQEYEYDGVKAEDLKQLLEKNKQWVNLCGKWVTTSGKAVTTSSYDSYYHETYWEHEFSPGDYSVELVCVINDDGSVNIKGNGSVFIITNFSTISAGLKHEIKKFNINTTVNGLGTIKIDEYTTLTLQSDKIVLNYKKTEKEVAYFTYKYTANCTYGKKTESY